MSERSQTAGDNGSPAFGARVAKCQNHKSVSVDCRSALATDAATRMVVDRVLEPFRLVT